MICSIAGCTRQARKLARVVLEAERVNGGYGWAKFHLQMPVCSTCFRDLDRHSEGGTWNGHNWLISRDLISEAG